MSIRNDIDGIAQNEHVSAHEFFNVVTRLYHHIKDGKISSSEGQALSDKLTVRDERLKPTANRFSYLLWDFAEWNGDSSDYAQSESRGLMSDIEEDLTELKESGWFESKKMLGAVYEQRTDQGVIAARSLLIIDDAPGFRLRSKQKWSTPIEELLMQYNSLEQIQHYLPKMIGEFRLRGSEISWGLARNIETVS
ncbi:hypothetical protein KBC99_02435 [Candidatus Saccharibacteria bacterium]|nr:hypothetical protein [Candidatus Saccharibacteria bacterium]